MKLKSTWNPWNLKRLAMLCFLKILLDKLYAPSQNYHLKPWLRFPAQLLLQKLPVIHPTGASIFMINRKVKLQEATNTSAMQWLDYCHYIMSSLSFTQWSSNNIQQLFVTKCPNFLWNTFPSSCRCTVVDSRRSLSAMTPTKGPWEFRAHETN